MVLPNWEFFDSAKSAYFPCLSFNILITLHELNLSEQIGWENILI